MFSQDFFNRSLNELLRFLADADKFVSETFETFIPRSHYHQDT